MKVAEKALADVGVIVGRFQVHELHEAHLDLIRTVSERHSKTIVFLGLSPCMVTRHNPLDFESRKQMVLAKFPNVIVLYIKDTRDDDAWSRDLDGKIGDVIGPTQKVVLYGSRDSFIAHYAGRYSCEELVPEVFVSGSEVRKNLSSRVRDTPEFRAGVIWAAHNKFPTTYTTVDIAVFDGEGFSRILLGRKPSEKLYRFIGGFSEPDSHSFEEDVRREVNEEAVDGEISEPVYIGSRKMDDWRYTHDVDKIKTLFFCARIVFGTPRAGDDLSEVKWFDFHNFDKSNLVEGHRELWDMLVAWINRDKK